MTMAETDGMNEIDRSEDIRALLRRHGLRYSRPREAIMEIFRDGSSHVSAESLHHSLRKRGEEVSLSTVYLNLNVLRDAGLVQEFRGVGGESLYDHNVMPHYHLICRETGRVIDVPPIEIDGVPLARFLKERVERETGWTIEEPRFDLRGLSPLAVAGTPSED
jgi:Fur family peroxide stress response transcriptional regulator